MICCGFTAEELTDEQCEIAEWLVRELDLELLFLSSPV